MVNNSSFAVRLIIPTVLLLSTWSRIQAQADHNPDIPAFMGRQVTVTEPKLDPDGLGPMGPASVCVEEAQRQCYTAPHEFGVSPTVEVVPVKQGLDALFFRVQSFGVSGWAVHFALLRSARTGKSLENLFPPDTLVSNQSQHAFWNEPSISDAQIFLTAEYDYGPDESHYGEHRYIISAYVLRTSTMLDGLNYYLEDRYMTVRRYDLDANADVLGSERQEILARLARVKAETERQRKQPR
jgi:hypothetical protein